MGIRNHTVTGCQRRGEVDPRNLNPMVRAQLQATYRDPLALGSSLPYAVKETSEPQQGL